MYSEKKWFGDGFGWHPTGDGIRKLLASKGCPMDKFIGNSDAVDLLKAVAFFAWKNDNHAIVNRTSGEDEKINIALLGSAGLGKTTLAKMFSETVKLPLVELHRVTKAQEIFDAINKGLPEETPIAVHDGSYKCPPCIVFIDEVHRYTGKSRKSPSGIMNDLLKATEPDDARLTTDKWSLNCENICWVVATTEWHLLPSPFRSRFMEVKLFPYTEDEVAKIVKFRFNEIPIDICQLAAQYGCLVPRQALNFAKMFAFEKGYREISWGGAAQNVARKQGIDKWGMTAERREILALLGKHQTLSQDKLSMFSGQDQIELTENILPPLINPVNGDPLIQHGGRGWSILPAGIKELEKRNAA